MKILYRHPKSKMVGWPEWLPKYYNGSNEPCDMLEGPCACGAWHQPGEFAGVDCEIRDFPADAPRELRVEVCGEASVLQEEAAANFKEFLKLIKLPVPPLGVIGQLDFLESIGPSILKAGAEGRRFCRLPVPKQLQHWAAVKEWLAASGYQADFSELELTIQW